MKTSPKNPKNPYTPVDLSTYRAYLKGRVIVALGLEGNEQFQDGGVSILTQADSLVHSLSEEASVAFTIGVTQDALGDVLPKGIVEDMVAACLNPKESKAVKFKTEGVETGRLLGVRGRGGPRKPTQAS